MAKISNLDFVALNLSGDNYLQWALDAKIILKSKGLGECIEDGDSDDEASEKDKYKAISILRHHLAEGLKNQYLTIEDPMDLWNELKKRYGHQKLTVLPKARHEWLHLRLQDFKSIDDYNSALFEIVSKLKLCGETITEADMLEKTYSTFHADNVLLQGQYRERGFKTYSELIEVLLLAEQNNKLVLKNHEMRPTGSKPLPEANVAAETNNEVHHAQGNFHGRGRGRNRGRGRGFGRGRGQYNNSGQGRGSAPTFGRGRGRGVSFKHQSTNQKQGGQTKTVCYRCGQNNHWAKTCRAPKYFVDLYQKSLKGDNPEAHLAFQDEEGDFENEQDDLTEYETSDVLKE